MTKQQSQQAKPDEEKQKTLKADYDSAWKEILEKDFEPFLLFYFIEIHQDVDWRRQPEYLDKELQHIIGDAETGRIHADKLIKVWLKTGEPLHVLIHIEVQGSWEANYPKRIYTYNYRIFDKYQIPVVSISIFTDENSEWQPNLYEYKRWGFELSFKFLTKKLLDYKAKWQELENDPNPFAVITMANLKTLETRQNYEERFRWKLWMFRQLYKRGYNRPDIIRLLRFIDWMMTLPPTMKDAFSYEWDKLEEEHKVTYMMDIERVGYEQGIEQGIEQGRLMERRSMLVGTAGYIYRLSDHHKAILKEELNTIDSMDQLIELINMCLDRKSFDEFRERLNEILGHE